MGLRLTLGCTTMPRWLRLSTALLLLSGPTAALACSFVEHSEEERFAEASAIFLARVVQTEEIAGLVPVRDGRPFSIIEAKFLVIEVFKGQPPTDGKVRSLKDPDGAACAEPLLAPHDYLFFLGEDGF